MNIILFPCVIVLIDLTIFFNPASDAWLLDLQRLSFDLLKYRLPTIVFNELQDAGQQHHIVEECVDADSYEEQEADLLHAGHVAQNQTPERQHHDQACRHDHSACAVQRYADAVLVALTPLLEFHDYVEKEHLVVHAESD